MVSGIFCSTANISTQGGGDIVSLHESNALSKFCDTVQIISAKDVPEETRRNPFAWDFYVSLLISRRYDVAHFNGHPFYRTINALKYYNPDIKIVTSVPAHNLEHSIEEHHKLGIDYEGLYPHMIGEKFYEYASQEHMADVVVYPSKYSMDYLSKRLSLTNRQMVIPHGVDTPSKYPTYPSDPSVGYIGALGPDKGINYLLRAMKELLRSNLTLYGKQTEGAMSPAPNVKFYGGYRDLDEIMSKITFCVFPSVTEGFNIGALESMAYGRPVIIADGAGFAEYVTDGVDGLVVPRCNVPVLVESIKYLLDNPDVVAKMGAKAHEFSKLLQWKDVEVEYIKMYEGLFK